MKQVKENIFKQMDALGFIDFSKENSNYSQSKRCKYVEVNAFNQYRNNINKFVIVRKGIFKEMVSLGYIKKDESGKYLNSLKIDDQIFVLRVDYDEYLKYL